MLCLLWCRRGIPITCTHLLRPFFWNQDREHDLLALTAPCRGTLLTLRLYTRVCIHEQKGTAHSPDISDVVIIVFDDRYAKRSFGE